MLHIIFMLNKSELKMFNKIGKFSFDIVPSRKVYFPFRPARRPKKFSPTRPICLSRSIDSKRLKFQFAEFLKLREYYFQQ